MRDEQRRFLLADFEGFVEDLKTDSGPEGQLGPVTARLVERFGVAIDWLCGQRPADAELRQFFEQRLAVFERELNYQPIVFEREALAAAVEALR